MRRPIDPDDLLFQEPSPTMPAAAPIFIGGAPRSGTTLLRMILDSHSAIACGPELRAIPQLCELYRVARVQAESAAGQAWALNREGVSDNFAALILALLEPSRIAGGKRRIAEKTPANGLWFAELREIFPDCLQVHMLRDGRDVVASLLGMDWRDGRTGELFAFVRDAGAAAALWVQQTRAARAAFQAPAASGRVFELRYEAVVRTPREALKPLFAFVGEAWEEGVLDFHANPSAGAGENESSAGQVSRPLYGGSIGRWRRVLTPRQVTEVMEVAGPQLAALGYGEAD